LADYVRSVAPVCGGCIARGLLEGTAVGHIVLLVHAVVVVLLVVPFFASTELTSAGGIEPLARGAFYVGCSASLWWLTVLRRLSVCEGASSIHGDYCASSGDYDSLGGGGVPLGCKWRDLLG